jgi:lactate racemase
MQIVLNYGRDGLAIDLPDDWDVTVIRKPEMPVLDDPPGAVAWALANPVESKPLSELARGRESACIAICDVTRPVPNGIFLRPVISELLDSGISADRITVLVATGLHRPNLGDELRAVVGDNWVMDTVRVENHYARNDQDHADVGVTSRGTPARIDKRFVEADLRIVTGLVEPHFMAGYSGGRKLITPGMAHYETITRIHSAEFLENPGAANCVLAGNPVHEDQIEIMRMVGEVYALNTVIDEHRKLSHVNFGEAQASHLAAVEYLRPYAEVPVPRRFHTVVTTCAGYPLDGVYYQACKGMVAALDIVEPGGNLFIATECGEGIGSAEFADAQDRLVKVGADQFLRDILDKRHAAIDEWGTEMQLKAMRHAQVSLYTTGLSECELAATGMRTVASLEDAIRTSVEESGDNRVAVIPEGPYLVPRVKQ